MHVATIITFDGVLDYERLLTDLSGQLHLVPRYRQRVMSVPFGVAHPTWEPDPQFDVRDHVHRHSLPPSGTDAAFADLCNALYGQPLDRRRPLWEMHLIDGHTGGAPGEPDPSRSPSSTHDRSQRARSVLVIKVHHCMVDGVSGIALLRVLLDIVPDPPLAVVPASPPPCPPLPGRSRRFLDGCRDRIGEMIPRRLAMLATLMQPRLARYEVGQAVNDLAHVAHTFLENAPRTPLNGRLGSARALGWVAVSLSHVRAIKHALGGSINDVVLAIVSGALRRVLEERGMDPEGIALRCLVPVSVRGAHEEHALGNRLSVMVVPLPVGVPDPVERLRHVRAATAKLKTGRNAAKVARVIRFADMLPPQLHQLVGWLQQQVRPINTICTNMAGPPMPLYLQGVRARGIVPLVPLVEDLGVAFAVVSYGDALTFGVTANPGVVPQPEAVAAALRRSLDDLLTAACPDRTARAASPIRTFSSETLEVRAS
jgi:WS/DGAT/MGAT family acyltransferase